VFLCCASGRPKLSTSSRVEPPVRSNRRDDGAGAGQFHSSRFVSRVVGRKPRSIAFSAIQMLPIRNIPWSSTTAAIFTEPRLEGAPRNCLGRCGVVFKLAPHRAAGPKRFCIALPAALTEINRAAASFLAGADCSMGARVSEGRGSARILMGFPVAAPFTKCSRKARCCSGP
jgi:hypothetical protein